MDHFLFAAYLVVFAWLVTKVPFFRKSGLSSSQLIILFLLKVMAGIFYGWIGLYYSDMAKMIDTWAYHTESLTEYATLKTNPARFFTDIFHTTYEGGYTNFLTSHNSWWNDIKANFLIKIMALFNLFSFGSYYTNVIFISFLTLFGPIAFYRVMKHGVQGQKLPILLGCFLIPSFLYWTSGLHKEGLIFTGLALLIYHIYFGFEEKRFPVGRLLAILLGFVLVLILRNFLVLPLLPALAAWVLARGLRWKPLPVFAAVLAISITLFFTASHFLPSLNMPESVVTKQDEFLHHKGGSSVEVNRLEPNFGSFVRNTPQAISLSLLRPYPSDVHHLLALAAAIEICLLLILMVLPLFFRRHFHSSLALLLFCVCFALGVLLMIGYTVNVLGAIVRYRSIVLPLLVVPMMAATDWNRIGRMLSGNPEIK